MIQRVSHNIVSAVADDLRSNTLSYGTAALGGAVAGTTRAYTAATTGFTMLERQVAQKVAIGAVKGTATGLVGGHATTKLIDAANLIGRVESWFDNTRVGRAIDAAITKGENALHRVIGGGSY